MLNKNENTTDQNLWDAAKRYTDIFIQIYTDSASMEIYSTECKQ